MAISIPVKLLTASSARQQGKSESLYLIKTHMNTCNDLQE